jgi:hypothetical protein
LAARPKTAAAGRNPFPDLLFLALPAFIWDHTRGAVTWTNGAARSKSGLSAQELQAALPASLLRQFERLAQGSGSERHSPVKLRLGPNPPVICSVELIELAGGHRGFIVAEEAAAETESARSQPRKPDLPASASGPAKSPQRPGPKTRAVPQLTPEELKAFKAIGRKVRALTKEKQRAPVPAKRPAGVPFEARPAPGFQAAQAILCSAFDLVLFLDKEFRILKCVGRPQRIGLRKPDLAGKPAAQLLPLAERGAFAHMSKKVSLEGAQICRDGFIVGGETGGTPCRLTLGRWPDDGACYFLAVLSLAMPSRLKRLQAEADSPLHFARLAA